MRRAGRLHHRVLVAALTALAALTVASCGRDDSQRVTARAIVPEPEFMEVAREKVGRSGAENKYGDPDTYLLLGSADTSAFDSEQDLLDAYVAELRDEGWWVEPTEPDGPYWWQFKATDGARYASLGRLSVFVEHAGILEGSAPRTFSAAAAKRSGPLVVVSIDT